MLSLLHGGVSSLQHGWVDSRAGGGDIGWESGTFIK